MVWVLYIDGHLPIALMFWHECVANLLKTPVDVALKVDKVWAARIELLEYMFWFLMDFKFEQILLGLAQFQVEEGQSLLAQLETRFCLIHFCPSLPIYWWHVHNHDLKVQLPMIGMHISRFVFPLLNSFISLLLVHLPCIFPCASCHQIDPHFFQQY